MMIETLWDGRFITRVKGKAYLLDSKWVLDMLRTGEEPKTPCPARPL